METQTLMVLAIIGTAVGYLALRALRTLRRSKPASGSCGGDDCGCGH